MSEQKEQKKAKSPREPKVVREPKGKAAKGAGESKGDKPAIKKASTGKPAGRRDCAIYTGMPWSRT